MTDEEMRALRAAFDAMLDVIMRERSQPPIDGHTAVIAGRPVVDTRPL